MENSLKKQSHTSSSVVFVIMLAVAVTGCNEIMGDKTGAKLTPDSSLAGPVVSGPTIEPAIPLVTPISDKSPSLKAADTAEAFEKNIKSYLLELMEEQTAKNEALPVSSQPFNGLPVPASEAAAPSAGAGVGGGAASGSASIAAPVAAIDGASRAGAVTNAGGTNAGGKNSSGTNLVEQEVDESDLVKSDGRHLFIGRQAVYEYNNYIRPVLAISSGAVLEKSGVAASEAVASGTVVVEPVDGAAIIGIFPPIYNEPTLIAPAVVRVMALDNSTPSSKEVGLIKLPNTVNQILGLYFSKKADDGTANQLIVVTSIKSVRAINTDALSFYQDNNIHIFSYDITNPEQAVQQWDMEIEGYYQASRSMNGKLYIVSSKYFRLQSIPNFITRPIAGSKGVEENKQLIENLTIDDILPATWVNNEKLPLVQADLCLVPNEVSANRIYQTSMLTVFTIPIDQPEKTQSLCTVESSTEVYVSPNAIYFTKGEYVYNEKDPRKSKNFTLIHKLRFTEDSVTYNGSIRISGWTGWRNKAFRMSELNDDLRIVVSDYEFIEKDIYIDPIKPAPVDGVVTRQIMTVSPSSAQELEVVSEAVRKADIAGNVDVAKEELAVDPDTLLQETPLLLEPIFSRTIVERRLVHKLLVIRESTETRSLKVLSQLPNKDHPEKIGKPGEDIYAVRFFGDYAYVVTFRRTDPLYAINLTIPESPFIEGELSIPGFSEYLHPINKNLLLGVGKQADENGRVKGLKIALFDVTDKSNPITIDELKLGNSGSSTALSYDYKAFAILSDAETGLHRITVPVNIFDNEVVSQSGFVYYNWSYSGLQLAEIDDGSVSTMPSLTSAGILRAFMRTKEMQYHYVNQPRGLMVGDAVHYIEKAKVWSAKWDSPKDVVGPN